MAKVLGETARYVTKQSIKKFQKGETGCQALKLDRSDYDLVSSIKKVLRPLKR